MTLRKLIPLLLMAVACFAAVASASEQDAIPAGTKLVVKLKTKLTTKTNRKGDRFTAEIVRPISSGNVELVAAGSDVHGHIDDIQRPGHSHGATMRLVVDTIAARSGMVYALSPGIQRLTSMRDAGAQGTTPDSSFPQGLNAPPGFSGAAMVVHYKEIVLNPGAELTFLLKQPVAVAPRTAE
jgi:hypothetical protein